MASTVTEHGRSPAVPKDEASAPVEDAHGVMTENVKPENESPIVNIENENPIVNSENENPIVNTENEDAIVQSELKDVSDDNASDVNNKPAMVITKEMQIEEDRLQEASLKEEEERKKVQEIELHKMDGDMREQRYKRLQFLLTKSNMYTNYLLRRMQKQKEDEEKLAELKKERRARKLKQQEESSNPETNHDNAELENKTTPDCEPVSPGVKEQESLQPSEAAGTSPKGHTTRSGQLPQQKTVEKKRGTKRKAQQSPKITDMFAEVLQRNKKRKEDEENASVQNENEQDEQNTEGTKDTKENEPRTLQVCQQGNKICDNEMTSSSKQCTQEELENAALGRYINGEAVPSCQPELFSGGILRDYQVDGFRWLKVLFENGVNGILADEMGLGKTIQCIAVISSLVKQGLIGPFLVVAPLSTVPNWTTEFEKFAPKVPVILYHGSQHDRTQLRRKIMKKNVVEANISVHPVVITSFEMAMNDRKYIGHLPWKYIIVDEGHRIKNYQCKLVKELKMYNSTHRLLLTGTPLQNNLQELWSLLNFLLPEIFDDLGSFESWFDISFLESDSSNEAIVVEEQRNSILSMLHQILSPFMLRRIKADVALNIPPKREVMVYAPLAVKQQEQYRSIVDRTIRKLVEGDKEKEMESFSIDKHGRSIRRRNSRFSKKAMQAVLKDDEENVDENDSDIEQWFRSTETDQNNNSKCTQVEPKSSRLNIQLRNVMAMLRKCCNHPYLIEYPLDESGDYRIDDELLTTSGKLQVLDRMLVKLKQEGHKVLIFSQMTQILNVLEDYCYLKEYQYCRLDGSMKIESRREQISIFNKDPDVFLFLLSTRAGGLGINLTAADTCIIFDSDWNPQCDLQAQDRCHRIGQTRPVMVYRLVTANTIDQKIVERAAAKRKLEKMVITKGKFTSGGVWGTGAEEVSDKALVPMSAPDLLALLRSTDYDARLEVISDEDLTRLLDRSDLVAQWQRNKLGNVDASLNTEIVDRCKEVKGVFKVLAEDLGQTQLNNVS